MAPRARRRRSRYTPRRWLPFLALSALIAGAALLDTDRPPVAPERLDPSLDITAVPSVARADAISTAFYCAGGTAQGEDGPAELSLVFANDADTGATAEVTVLSDTADPATTEVEVPANGRARLRLGEV
ncbi:MAG TPA: hypothetical protein P5254_01420, partial [Aquihabitans sp.]|nr:hypothetical protein [Aquihabitans sp.]